MRASRSNSSYEAICSWRSDAYFNFMRKSLHHFFSNAIHKGTGIKPRLETNRIVMSTDDSIGLARIVETLRQCLDQHVDIVCFPETYLPGLRGTD
jgi:hypothetical protein